MRQIMMLPLDKNARAEYERIAIIVIHKADNRTQKVAIVEHGHEALLDWLTNNLAKYPPMAYKIILCTVSPFGQLRGLADIDESAVNGYITETVKPAGNA